MNNNNASETMQQCSNLNLLSKPEELCWDLIYNSMVGTHAMDDGKPGSDWLQSRLHVYLARAC